MSRRRGPRRRDRFAGRGAPVRTNQPRPAESDPRAALRAEKREAVLAYLRTMQECQQLVTHVVDGTVTGSEREDQSSTFEKEVWLAQKALALTASAQLRRASFRLAERMAHVMFNDLPRRAGIVALPHPAPRRRRRSRPQRPRHPLVHRPAPSTDCPATTPNAIHAGHTRSHPLEPCPRFGPAHRDLAQVGALPEVRPGRGQLPQSRVPLPLLRLRDGRLQLMERPGVAEHPHAGRRRGASRRARRMPSSCMVRPPGSPPRNWYSLYSHHIATRIYPDHFTSLAVLCRS